MREILFRGKSNAGGWVYGVPLEIGEYCEICYFNSETMETEYYLVIPETMGQYTGLTDKNGKKIFENDIVNFDDRIYYVKYVNGVYRLTNSHHFYSESIHNWYSFFEVIGNIHDNPELLNN